MRKSPSAVEASQAKALCCEPSHTDTNGYDEVRVSGYRAGPLGAMVCSWEPLSPSWPVSCRPASTRMSSPTAPWALAWRSSHAHARAVCVYFSDFPTRLSSYRVTFCVSYSQCLAWKRSVASNYACVELMNWSLSSVSVPSLSTTVCSLGCAGLRGARLPLPSSFSGHWLCC